MAPLIGKVAIVTGASRGIGRAIAERLAQDGASVVINYAQSADKAKEVVSAIEAKGGKALAVQADMSKVADIRRLFQKTINYFGQLDILVNNAGSSAFKPLIEVTEDEFNKLFALNARGTFFALQEAAREMVDGGRIVNISSSVTVHLQAGIAVYAASKVAVEQFTMVLAKELGGRGITVNCVMPGPTIPGGVFEGAPPELQKAAAESSPFGRLGHASDIADIIAFLVSDQARWLTGQKILANGGSSY